ncbi:MAG: hypothetical protein SWX82_21560 [Cyanobacteriota bacterium]|nr:hypothetical protein [Cyanobacteriota bacterium]
MERPYKVLVVKMWFINEQKRCNLPYSPTPLLPHSPTPNYTITIQPDSILKGEAHTHNLSVKIC